MSVNDYFNVICTKMTDEYTKSHSKRKAKTLSFGRKENPKKKQLGINSR